MHTRTPFPYIWAGLGFAVMVAIGASVGLHQITRPTDTLGDVPANQQNAGVTTTQFITANPINLSQVDQISVFRSCVEKDFSGLDVDGVSETNRSMNHYIQPLESLLTSGAKIAVNAPFNGVIKAIVPSDAGSQVWLVPTVDATWNMVIDHLDLAPGFSIGSEITSSVPLGFAHVSETNPYFAIALVSYGRALKGTEYEKFISVAGTQSRGFIQTAHAAIDITGKTNTSGQTTQSPTAQISGLPARTLDSLFNHMIPSISKQYVERGVSATSAIFSKQARDDELCDYGSKKDSSTYWVELH